MPAMDDADQFFLRWDNFHTNLVEGFQSLLEAEDLLDVTLVAEDEHFQAHKVVLSAYSTYFRKIFKANPCRHPVIILKDVNSKDLNSILQFMYRGEAVLRRRELRPFLQTARTLNIKGLIEHDASTNASLGPNDDAVPSGLTTGPVNVAEADDSDSDSSGWDSLCEASPNTTPLTPGPHFMTPDVDREPDSTAHVTSPVHFVTVQDMREREHNNADDDNDREEEGETTGQRENSLQPHDLLQGTSQDWDLCRVKVEEVSPPAQGTSSAIFSAVGLAQVGQEPGARIIRKPIHKRVSRASMMEPFKCPLCEKSYLLKSSLRMHMTMSHKGIKNRKTSLPTKTLKDSTVSKPLRKGPSLLLQGQPPVVHNSDSYSMEFRCASCNESFLQMEDLQSHNENYHKNSDEPLTCPRCGRIYKNWRSLGSHLYHIHQVRVGKARGKIAEAKKSLETEPDIPVSIEVQSTPLMEVQGDVSI